MCDRMNLEVVAKNSMISLKKNSNQWENEVIEVFIYFDIKEKKSMVI